MTPLWLPAALIGGALQAWRTAVQRRVSRTLSVNAAGLVRYLYGLPVAILLVLLFFISGADANTFVLAMMTSDGTLTPRRGVLILWGVLTGVTAVVLMFAGGLNALQNTVIVASLPFLVIIAVLTVSFWKDLIADNRHVEPQTPLVELIDGQVEQ